MDAESLTRLIAWIPAVPFWLVWAALAGLALLLLRHGAQAFWRLLTLADTPRARLPSAPQGYVELAGLARPHNGEIQTRLTGKPCLWCRYRIEERRQDGRSDIWATLEQGETDTPFLLVDRKGSCLVEPAGAQVLSRHRRHWVGSGPAPNPGRRGSWHGALSAGLGLGPGVGEQRRYTEERIESGDLLYLLGHFETPSRGPEERERLRLGLLRVWKRDPRRVAALTDSADGAIDPSDWERLRERAAHLADLAEAKRRRAPALPVIRRPLDDRQPFLISNYTEQELIRSLGWRSLGYTLGFLGLAAVLGYGLAARLGTVS